jgi:hypothetical protein
LADAGILFSRYIVKVKRRAAMAEYYEIKIKGHLDQHWSDSFADLEFTYLDGNVTLLSGMLPDQAAIHGLLERIRDLNLTLVSVTCGDPPIESLGKQEKGA